MLKGELEISAFPRLHITLIGMNNSGYRINGGIGFSIENPGITARISKSNVFNFQDNRVNAFSEDQCKRLKEIIDSARLTKQFEHSISVSIEGELYTHSGLGSGTIIRLICLEAIHILNDASYDETMLIQLSGRGGTSGIGIRTYFHGGFVFDIGHKNLNQELLPSSSVENRQVSSLLVDNGKMPNWEIGLCFPHSVKSLSEEEERAFFKKIIPISEESVSEILYHTTYGVYGAIKELDKPGFELAINNIQHLAWKAAERGLYKNYITSYETELFKSGASCVGMSSLGPCLFFTANSIDDVIRNMEESEKQCTLIKTRPMNEGRMISVCTN